MNVDPESGSRTRRILVIIFPLAVQVSYSSLTA
jgi:hypothetical protein